MSCQLSWVPAGATDLVAAEDSPVSQPILQGSDPGGSSEAERVGIGSARVFTLRLAQLPDQEKASAMAASVPGSWVEPSVGGPGAFEVLHGRFHSANAVIDELGRSHRAGFRPTIRLLKK